MVWNLTMVQIHGIGYTHKKFYSNASRNLYCKVLMATFVPLGSKLVHFSTTSHFHPSLKCMGNP
jgi:hypothetical protein